MSCGLKHRLRHATPRGLNGSLERRSVLLVSKVLLCLIDLAEVV